MPRPCSSRSTICSRLGLRLLERLLGLGHSLTSSTRAPNAPCATTNVDANPDVTSALDVTTFDSGPDDRVPSLECSQR